jgi:hypothetical protein
MAAPTKIGITQVSELTAQSVEITSQGEIAILVNKDGVFSNAVVFDPKFSFTVSGKGSLCPIQINSDGTGKPTAVTGKVIVNSVKNQTNNDDFQSWEYSGEGFPAVST